MNRSQPLGLGVSGLALCSERRRFAGIRCFLP